MIAKMNGVNEHEECGEQDGIPVHSITNVPVTEERKPYINDKESKLQHAAVARANLAPSEQTPQGSTKDDWAKKHAHQTVLQQHCDFFDRDHDGVLWPQDTFIGFYRLGLGIFFSAFAVLVIHINFSYPTCPGWLPDPYFRLFLHNVHRARHGSDTGTYDTEGRFIPAKFEEIFTKYADGRDYLTFQDLRNVLSGQRNINDPIGWCGFIFEWSATYLMLWPEDGRLMKEDIRAVYDGSIFQKIADKREQQKRVKKG
ncbi:caleosin domain containing protein [Pyrenophora tritici-repentis Pt-1C-BFP]|uniref:Caleosin domain containing protein n=2 Tax=Pyrenophora tritici-repentis TaxID=45151 RepID=B2VUB2_PYRTR|nr:caleosin domain containing protein [Pyrenophora tritici-repentis Pt-1C-BFP]EDU41523.1 caleosin domain containing protein [Pyrenophora tritici-repentis Pt-1C-BFP]